MLIIFKKVLKNDICTKPENVYKKLKIKIVISRSQGVTKILNTEILKNDMCRECLDSVLTRELRESRILFYYTPSLSHNLSVNFVFT